MICIWSEPFLALETMASVSHPQTNIPALLSPYLCLCPARHSYGHRMQFPMTKYEDQHDLHKNASTVMKWLLLNNSNADS